MNNPKDLLDSPIEVKDSEQNPYLLLIPQAQSSLLDHIGCTMSWIC